MANQAEAAPVRGLLLIGIAVLIGMLFLSKGFDNGGVTGVSADEIAGATTTVPTSVGTGTDTGDTTDTIAPAAHNIAELPVLVVNGSGVSGQATTVTATLTSSGYTAAIPPSGAAPTVEPTTIVYYYSDETNDYQADATAVAALLGLQPTQVMPLPADLGVDIGNATVVVMLGQDLAQG